MGQKGRQKVGVQIQFRRNHRQPALISAVLLPDSHRFVLATQDRNAYKGVTLEAEVQFVKKDMVRNINDSSHRCMRDSLFCGKIEGIESDAAE
jgi:hypothetical protein